MPHFHIEYSANLEEVVDMGQLCEEIRAAAASVDAFPMPGIRVRATRVDHFAIADGDPKHGFIDLSIRIREGRPDAVKQDAVDQVFEALRAFLAPAMADHSIALSAELRDINAALSPKFGNIRDHMGHGS
ncbi:5-carboxymethyl-2-hydroxymuconate Delta-isomerase [Ruegeria sp. EL01]|jgi:5-carboxymethyl-2-hydroxymuconate isomerase|uniref:5-carboxymethyl-2-hydroxymuconate Delta-isomerase n=1 Tax=Ruegeria sp. EL01 TaxID=2107578 RepID=UPI000EA7F5BB|nr:5-carboxymethyl-2-hydroxymuconate Delta-isomerase [Ruegeria sp. EL01]